MFSKPLSLGIVFPKVVSETKVAVTKVPASKAAKRNAVILPRASSAKPAFRIRSYRMAVPAISVLSLAVVVGLLGYRLYSVNAYSGKGFELKRHQAAIKDLTDQQKRLLIQQAELGSISKVSETAGVMGMVPVTREEFVTSNQLTQK